MKIIRYLYRHTANIGTEEEPNYITTEVEHTPRYSEDALAIAKRQAYNGEYTVEDIPDEPQEPTTEQRVSELEEQIIQADETAITLYEAQEAQEAINAQQDEALMEIYEMIG